MRIVVIADCIDTQKAGIHVYTKNMIEALEKISGLEIICIRRDKNLSIKFKNDITVQGIIPFLKKDPFRVFFTIPNAIKKLNPDIVIEPAHFGPFNLPKKIKRVTIIHDLTPIKLPHLHNFFSRNLQRLFLPSVLKRASLIITNSENTSKDVRETYPFTANKIARIYPGTDPFFKIEKDELVKNKDPYFLSVGTIEPRKNLTLLLESYQLFREKTNRALSLVICGENGWKNKDFYRQLHNHPFKNDIKLLGYTSKEELKRLYSKTTAFIYTSIYEGFGFPIAEAMGCGAPCIVSGTSSLPEAGGGAALYFNPLSSSELCALMIQVSNSNELQNELIIKGFQQIEKFDWACYATNVEELLKSLND
jgi:glycosyltransferase involved in cell wall biosynthesis